MIRDSLRIAWQLVAAQRRQWWSADRIRDFQERRLADTLRYAMQSVEHYRSNSGLRGDKLSAADLTRFPVLTKQAVQESRGRLLADGYNLEQCKLSTTSGSTGEPTTTAFDSSSWLLCKYALKIRRMLAHGVGIGKRVLIVTEMSPAEIRTTRALAGAGLLFQQQYVSIHDSIESNLAALRNYNPDAIYAFPSFFGELLEYCENQGEIPPSVAVVFSSSEVLSDALRQRIESSMQAQVCDIYGSTEFKEVAWQCPFGRYHVNFESVWIETVDVKDDGFGTVLLTSLVNRAMPLIRYRVGDRGRLASSTCRCGRSGPALEAVSGREVEMLHLPDGRRISPYLLTTVLELDQNMRRYQLIQQNPTTLLVRYIGAPGESVDERMLETKLAELLGEDMLVEFQRSDNLPRTLRGKQKVFLRDYAPEEIANNTPDSP